MTEPAAAPPPTLDDLGVLRNGDAWVALSPIQEAIMRPLIDRFGQAVSRTEVTAATWPDGGPSSHAMDIHLHRLRPRLREVGLVVHTLRSRGFLLERATDGTP